MFFRNRFLVKLLLLDQPVAVRSDEEVVAEVLANYRWNFTANVLDGFAFFFGIAFASSSTIVPLFVSKITLNPWIIGLVAMIAQSAWYIPQLLTADKIESLDRKKPVLINLGFFTERLPVFLWPLAALLALDYPMFALVLFICAYAAHGLGAGVVGPAWQDLLARCFPVNTRGFVLGLTMFTGTAAGTVGAAMSSWLLQAYPYPQNFVYLFSIAAVAITMSWAFLATVREPLQPAKRHAHAALPMWSRMRAILGQDSNFRTYLLARMLLIMGSMGTGFITVVTIERWHLADSVVGFYTAILLLGQTAGNLLSGVIADRAGHKLPLVVGGLCQMFAFAVAWSAPTPAWIYMVFALLGLATGANFVSGMLITMEFPEPSRRPTYIGIANTAIGIALALAPLLGGWVASWGYGWLFGGSALLSLVATIWMQLAVAEPRHVRPVDLAALEASVKPAAES
jgi:MFS family permease